MWLLQEEQVAQAAASLLWLNNTSTTLGSARVERSPRSVSLRAIWRRIRLMIFPEEKKEVSEKQEEEEEEEEEAPAVTWAGLGQSWGVLNEVRSGDWSDPVPYCGDRTGVYICNHSCCFHGNPSSDRTLSASSLREHNSKNVLDVMGRHIYLIGSYSVSPRGP